MITFDKLDDLCLQLVGAVREHPFGPDHAVYKVGGKMFALAPIDEDPARVNLKCDPLMAQALRDEWTQVTPGYHMNKRHWNTVVMDDGLPTEVAIDMVEDSYDLVVASLPKRLRPTID
jgi:predicted DNA-binding protein (MmcQ/YjbR family)